MLKWIDGINSPPPPLVARNAMLNLQGRTGRVGAEVWSLAELVLSKACDVSKSQLVPGMRVL